MTAQLTRHGPRRTRAAARQSARSRGFDGGYEHIEDIKRKRSFLVRRESRGIIHDDGSVLEVEKTVKAAMLLMEYIGFAQDIEI